MRSVGQPNRVRIDSKVINGLLDELRVCLKRNAFGWINSPCLKVQFSNMHGHHDQQQKPHHPTTEVNILLTVCAGRTLRHACVSPMRSFSLSLTVCSCVCISVGPQANGVLTHVDFRPACRRPARVTQRFAAPGFSRNSPVLFGFVCKACFTTVACACVLPIGRRRKSVIILALMLTPQSKTITELCNIDCKRVRACVNALRRASSERQHQREREDAGKSAWSERALTRAFSPRSIVHVMRKFN